MLIIGIAGGTGSGKTTVVNQILNELNVFNNPSLELKGNCLLIACLIFLLDTMYVSVSLVNDSVLNWKLNKSPNIDNDLIKNFGKFNIFYALNCASTPLFSLFIN